MSAAAFDLAAERGELRELAAVQASVQQSPLAIGDVARLDRFRRSGRAILNFACFQLREAPDAAAMSWGERLALCAAADPTGP